jgi:hypothetical protein
MSWSPTPIGHGEGQAGGNNATCTTAPFSTIGASLVYFVVSDFQSSAKTTLTNNHGDTIIEGTEQSTVGGARVRLCWIINPTSDANYTVTATGAGSNYPSICAESRGGGNVAPFDQQNGAQINNTFGSPGSVTPTENNELVVTVEGHSAAGSLSVDSGFGSLRQQDFVGGTSFGSAMASLVQTTAGAVNPVWTTTTSQISAAAIGTFKEGVVVDLNVLIGEPITGSSPLN